MKIFASSTYIDLKEHRKAVDNIINRLCLQYRGMEYFGARSFEPKEVSFNEIASCDAFIGIYAHRYGFIPDGDTKSITEQEFDFAKDKKIPSFCYIVASYHPWPPNLIEHNFLDKLNSFKEKVYKFVCGSFTTPDNLASQVAADLSRCITEQKSQNSLSITENILKEATAYGHDIAGRPHLLQCLLRNTSLFDVWLLPYGVSYDEIEKRLNNILSHIQAGRPNKSVKMSLSLIQIIRRAHELKSSECYDNEYDYLWVAIAEEVNSILLAEQSDSFITNSDKIWLDLFQSIPGLSMAVQMRTPHFDNKGRNLINNFNK